MQIGQWQFSNRVFVAPMAGSYSVNMLGVMVEVKL